MDPEDAELLLDDDVVKKETTIRKKERPTDKGVAWLVKTQYISPLSLDPAKQVGSLYKQRWFALFLDLIPCNDAVFILHCS
jgi:hypothetical protein